ncbi:ArsR family transcriptional regulator [Streptomyces sp. WAC05374]|uniref:ArsR/SmtB family transcription factor n=1 Tax=Streptomyces sp. WAC05374 TaxID=2487420 RepID=UPI000F88ACD2|nr:helix-turn-helix domain-containing protein [Streptomyces sp. WAC05374]RST11860.1 ArsR family transcriptional regulator [Streptomyces sp. WAC05374]TDF44368.1 ArsR family transcriptional regulator [Streptomyces sp. WAC05374]TDF53702.1 ArsR family transcriptional regulator [Streptomyces sp. WAC05374]TDF58535.1 ArsR family transcriptional regulator [Streptomyces sp. WAC05374]
MPGPEKKDTGAMPVRQLDPRSLRGLAHPLRIRLLAALRHHGPATASQLADRLGESSGATSYHLRQLASHGFVEDAPERGKGRERWWRAVHRGTTWDASLFDEEDPETRGAVNVFMHEIATIHGQELSTWIGTMRDWPAEWVKNADLSDFTLRLGPRQVRELGERLHALINSYSDAEPDEDAAKVRLHLHAFPQRDE